MKTCTLFLSVLLFLCTTGVMSQTKNISGTVTSAEDKGPIPGVTIVVKGTTIGTVTDVDGKYILSVPEKYDTLVFSYVGMTSMVVAIGNKTDINVVLQPSVTTMKEVVVTALGIPREKKSLGYSTQEVAGSDIQRVKTNNFVDLLSGQVAGATIRTNTNLGGSTDILLRGIKSLEGNNQPLFVVDGVPINNQNINTEDQQQSGAGYDFGNAASDINPEDIESINVLKGAAATALYGSRAANGVIMITMKKGKGYVEAGARQRIHVTLSSGITVGFLDSKTWPKYQQQYGAGYGHYYDGPGNYWYLRDLFGDGNLEQCVVTSEDASYGAPFDANLMVYQWDAFDPESPNYHKATPWIPAEHGTSYFFENPTTYVNSVAIDKAFNTANVRLSYTNYKQDGLIPNSSLIKNNALLNGSWNITDKFKASGSANYITEKATGRNETGYGTGYLLSFRQWMQTNVDLKEQHDIYFQTKRNVTWNYKDPTVLEPIFWDNYYWTAYENYENDSRNRFIGYLALDYKVLKWLDIYGRMSVDMYNMLVEERRAVGSIPGLFGIGTGFDGSLNRTTQGSGYLRRDYTYSEYNYDLMANFNHEFSKIFSIKAILGLNIRRTNLNYMINSTNGGLIVPEVYSLQNSAGPLALSKELASKIGVDGIYASASLGFINQIFVDLTLRRDHSSTLPPKNSTYYYPSFSGSWVFSNLMENSKWLSFGKVRLNYAQVGNSAPYDQLTDNYLIATPFNSASTYVPNTKKNPDLKPEITKSVEGGLEMDFFGRRLGFDVSLYKTNSINQIVPLRVSTATGYFYKNINAGNIQNKGIEISLNAVPVQTKNFKWRIDINWGLNRNKVISLAEGVENLQLGFFQGGVSITVQRRRIARRITKRPSVSKANLHVILLV